MKTVRMSFAASLTYVPPHPERTAKRNGTGLDMDVTFQEWPSRASMLKTMGLQSRGPHKSTHWRACKIPS